jgi:hypothetical protein
MMWTRAGVFAIAAALTSIFFIDFCALVFQCGCRSLWAGADAHCNIHHAGVRHCPWCELGGRAFWAVIVAGQAVVAFAIKARTAVRAVLTLATFPILGGLLAAAAGLATGYWAR